MIGESLQKKLDYYEQVYYSLDKPIPFKGDLMLYPVKVKDYYAFYSCFPCLTMDKTTKEIVDEFGMVRKVTDIEGLSKTYEGYLIGKMKDKEQGNLITAQVNGLFELVFKIPNGLFCPKCKKEIKYSDVLKGMPDFIEEQKNKAIQIFQEAVEKQEKETGEKIEDAKIPEELLKQIEQHAYYEFYQKSTICPDCEEKMRDIYSIKSENGVETFMIRDVEINSSDFEELKAVIPRQNILDYDGDKYIDPDLKEELQIKAEMKNKDYTAPTLEKQIICVAIGTGYSLEYLQEISMRKLSLLLRLIDNKETYYAQLQASLSGMVKFPEGSIKHWIFTDDKRNLKDEITSLDAFKDKFKAVT